MQTNRTEDYLANIDYGRVMAEANAQRAKMLRQMFRDAKAYVASLFTAQGATATQN